MILQCAKLCEASYDNNAPGFVDVDDLRYGVFTVEDKTVFVFRGTDPESLKNWRTDCRALPTRSCGGYLAHKGFVRGFQKLCSGGLPTGKNPEVYATGHSLGGAFATLMGEQTGCKVITFGSPRVYWRFGKAPNIDHIRVVRDDDPVPNLPFFTYSHRSDPLVLTDADRSFVDQMKDHFISGYAAEIERRGL